MKSVTAPQVMERHRAAEAVKDVERRQEAGEKARREALQASPLRAGSSLHMPAPLLIYACLCASSRATKASGLSCELLCGVIWHVCHAGER